MTRHERTPTLTDENHDATSTVLRELDTALQGYFARRAPRDEVEDLVQETYLKVSRGLPDLHDRERLSVWAFRVARNVLVDHFRRQKTTVPDSTAQELDEERLASPEEEVDLDLEVGRWMAPLIRQLPEKYAEVLRESELEELPHRVIAERLGMSVSGVKSRVQRGRAMLREKLDSCCRLHFDRRGGIREVERRVPEDGDCCEPEERR